jgi:7-cyano-7-deazaguanine synthase
MLHDAMIIGGSYSGMAAALQVALNLGMERRFVLHTPLMWLDKAATWKLAADLGGAALVDLIRDETHTCYLGDRAHRHAWGYGCGECPACDLRRKGWVEYADGAVHARLGEVAHV